MRIYKEGMHLSVLVGRSPGGDRVVHGGHSNTTIGTFPRGGVAQTVDGGSCEDDLLPTPQHYGDS